MPRRTIADLKEEVEQLEAENERLYRRCQRLTDALEDDDDEGDDEEEDEEDGDEEDDA